MLDKNISVTISTGTIIVTIFLVLLAALLYVLRDLVLVVLTAIIIASAIDPFARWFGKFRVPRVASVLLVYVVISSILFGIFFFFLPPILDEAAKFLNTVPAYLDTLSAYTPFNSGSIVSEFTGDFSLTNTIQDFRSSLGTVSEGFFQTVRLIFGGVLSFILIIVLSFYFAVQERGVEDFLAIVSPTAHQKRVLNLWERSKIKIGRWMQGQLILALIIGILVYLGLTVLGVRFALLFALLAAMLEIIPLFGPILASIPAIILGFSDGGVTLGLLVIGMYIIIQQFENHLIVPLVVTKVVGVPPVLVILALVVGAQLAGFLGMLIAVPVAAVLQELIVEIERSRRHDLSDAKKSA
jgi:predicted PurR-regulated permease PerM